MQRFKVAHIPSNQTVKQNLKHSKLKAYTVCKFYMIWQPNSWFIASSVIPITIINTYFILLILYNIQSSFANVILDYYWDIDFTIHQTINVQLDLK